MKENDAVNQSQNREAKRKREEVGTKRVRGGRTGVVVLGVQTGV